MDVSGPCEDWDAEAEWRVALPSATDDEVRAIVRLFDDRATPFQDFTAEDLVTAYRGGQLAARPPGSAVDG